MGLCQPELGPSKAAIVSSSLGPASTRFQGRAPRPPARLRPCGPPPRGFMDVSSRGGSALVDTARWPGAASGCGPGDQRKGSSRGRNCRPAAVTYSPIAAGSVGHQPPSFSPQWQSMWASGQAPQASTWIRCSKREAVVSFGDTLAKTLRKPTSFAGGAVSAAPGRV